VDQDPREGLLAVPKRVYGVPLGGEALGHDVRKLRFVFNEKYSHGSLLVAGKYRQGDRATLTDVP